MARDFLHLKPLSQSDILSISQKQCPKLNVAADMYQIIYSIELLGREYDTGAINPYFCDEPKCLVNALKRQRPIIILQSGHAVLLIGMDYDDGLIYPEGVAIPSTAYVDVVHPVTYYVMDPADKQNKVRKISRLKACTADAFIVS